MRLLRYMKSTDGSQRSVSVPVSHAHVASRARYVMGNCAPVSSKVRQQQQQRRWTAQWSSSATAKVIRADGKMEEYETAVPVGRVVARSPGYYVCSGEAMQVGAHPPVVGEGEKLQPGQLYFLLPLSYSHRPLSLPDLCLFAAKASAALRLPS